MMRIKKIVQLPHTPKGCAWKYEKAKILAYVILYRILLDVFYIYYVYPNWAYMDMGLRINPYKEVVSYVLIIICALWLEFDHTLSSLGLTVIFAVSVCPLSVTYALNDKPFIFMIFSVVSFLVTASCVYMFKTAKRTIFMERILPQASYKAILAVEISSIIVLILFTLMNASFNIGVLNIMDAALIYSIRRAGGVGYTGLLSYMYTSSYKVIIPTFFAWGLYKKKYIFSGILFVLQLMVYLSDPHKEILLGISLVFVLYIFGNRLEHERNVLRGLVVFFLVGLLVWMVLDSKLAFYWLDVLMRLTTIPSSIKFEYFEYFSKFPKLFLSEGRLGRLFGIRYPYPGQTVGQVVCMYFFGVNSNNNTGYLAYAYADLGYIGMIIVAPLLAVALRLLDKGMAGKEDYRWIGAVAVYIFIGLNDVGFVQWPLTGGYMVLLMNLYLYKRHMNFNLPAHSSRERCRGEIALGRGLVQKTLSTGANKGRK